MAWRGVASDWAKQKVAMHEGKSSLWLVLEPGDFKDFNISQLFEALQPVSAACSRQAHAHPARGLYDRHINE